MSTRAPGWKKFGSGMGKTRIRVGKNSDPGRENSDPGWIKFGSGMEKIWIQDKHLPEPQHWLTINEGREQLIASSEPSSRVESAQETADMGETVDRSATDNGKAAKTALLSRIFSKPPSGKYLNM
jgi:hypothetical protein